MLLDILSAKDRAPAECVIEVNQQPIEDLYPFLVEVTVETGRTEPAVATLTFESRRDEHGEWLVQDATGIDGREYVLREWSSILIKAVFGDREEEVLRGFIRQVKAEYPEDQGAARVIVECQDESLQLDREHRRKTWGTTDAPMSDTQIVTEMLGSYSPLSLDAESASGQSGLVGLNQDGTDIRFLKDRAEANGYELIFRGGTVYFGPMRIDMPTPQDTIMVYAGADSNCLSINVQSDSHQPDAVSFDLPGTDNASSTTYTVEPDLKVLGQTRASSADRGLTPFVWKLTGESGADEARLRAKAQQKANDADIHKVAADGELDGTLYGHVLLPGLPVIVDGLGSRLSGTYYVDAVSHTFSPLGYKQRFKLLRNAWGEDITALPTANPLANVMGAFNFGAVA
ncbi:MAG TPA: hypothetical protein VM532_13330 [Burkholderiales bacterium]|nr:hypothetical protein [Burkholderiales bacterium]